MSISNRLYRLAAGALISVGLSVAPASAAVVLELGKGFSPEYNGITVTCSVDCLGYFGGDPLAPGTPFATLSSVSASGYNLPSANEAQVATSFNNLTGSALTASDITKTDVGDLSNFVIPGAVSTAGQIIFFKYGQLTSFIQLVGADNVVTFNNGAPGPAGLSNWGTVVPLPAAAWLMLAGLGGLGLVAGRRKSAAA